MENNKSLLAKIKGLFSSKKEEAPAQPATASKPATKSKPAPQTDHAQQAPPEIRPIPTPKLARNDSTQHLEVVNQLVQAQDWAQIIAYLNSLHQYQMTPELYGYLSIAYNNSGEFVRALDTLALIPPAHRDYQWYYRAGYAYTLLALNNEDAETRTTLTQHAVAFLQHALSNSPDESINAHCQKMLGLLGVEQQ